MALGYGVAISDAAGFGTRHIKRLKDIKFRWVTGTLALVIMVLVLFTSYKTAVSQKMSRDANMAQFRWGYKAIFKDLKSHTLF